MLKLVDVGKKYKVSSNVHVQALHGINLELPDKGFVVIVGKSGCGKTTLLNLLGGLDKPTSGKIIYNDSEFGNFSAKEFDEFRNHHASFIFQDYSLLGDYSVIDNVKLAVSFQENSKKSIYDKSLEALTRVGLSELINRDISSLSGGQKQRVAIARALAKNSSIVLCDEPTGNLDGGTAKQIIELLRDVSKSRLVVIVTHDEDTCSFADRVIRLIDGMVAEDSVNTAHMHSKNAKSPQKQMSYGGITFKHSISMIQKNIRHSLITSSFTTILLASAFSLLIVFLSLARFNAQDSYVYTLKKNGQYVVQITKYIDSPVLVPNPENPSELITVNWIQLFYEEVKIEDIVKLQNKNPAANFYPSYFFYKSFQDFADGLLFFADDGQKHFEAIGFREVVVVDDFSTFYQELICGGHPAAGNEILIYDYMAHCLIYHGIFDGQISEIVGKSLIDKQTGLNITITGVLKSDYERYQGINGLMSGNDSRFKEAYLASLQTIFCNQEFIEQLKKEKPYTSVFQAIFWDQASRFDDDSIIRTSIKKIKHTLLDGIDFISTIADISNQRGLVLSKKQVATILQIDESLITKQMADDVMGKYQMYFYKAFSDYHYESTMYIMSSYPIIGIVEVLDEEQDVLMYYDNDWEYASSYNNSAFRQIYLSLTTDWNMNKQIMNNFIVQTHTEDFYAQNPGYYYEGYTDFNSFGVLIYEASSYLDKVRGFSGTIMNLLVPASFLGVFLFTFVTIKKYGYKIGVLKSLGAKNSDIALVFGLQLVVMTALAFLISIPISYIIMNSINNTFVSTINSNLIFFFIHEMNILYVFVGAIIVAISSAMIPLIKLSLSSPMTVIRGYSR